MSNNIKTFAFDDGLQLRSFLKDGEPWFVVSDVCKALSITNTSQAASSLDPEEKGFISTATPGGLQKFLAVSESGLYAVVMRSRKPAARPFQKWVTAVVLPALRRDGLYIVGQEMAIPEDLPLPALIDHIARLQARVNAYMEKRVTEWSARHQEEKDARRAAFKLLKSRR